MVTEVSKTPVRKVLAASGGAGIGVATANFVIWALDSTMFDPSKADSVPLAVTAWISLAVPTGCAFLAGYITKRAADE